MPALFTVEEGGTCRGKAALLRGLYRLGVCMITLTWDLPDELVFPDAGIEDADGTFRMAPDTECGLTGTGIAFVEGMERLGMIIDISHLNNAGIWNVFRYANRSLVASHSNARTMASHPRNLTDDTTRALVERNGIMGINYCTALLRDFGPEEEQLSRISDMVEHMKHIRKIGDIGYIGLDSDFDGINGNLEMGDTGKLPMLAGTMEWEGPTASEVEAIFCKNMLRVYKDILQREKLYTDFTFP